MTVHLKSKEVLYINLFTTSFTEAIGISEWDYLG
jgi:hypothetical protein